MNWKNRTIFTGDNLPVLRGLNTASVDMVYLDPPFNSKKQWSAPIGSQAAGAHFKDAWTWNDVKEAWHDEIRSINKGLHDVILASGASGGQATMSYLLYMGIRLLEQQRVLKDTGSIFLHCDPTESHSLKLMMDTIFGRQNFRNEIVWCYYGPGYTTRHFPRKHDYILFYAGPDAVFNKDAVRVPYAEATWNRSKYAGKPGASVKLDNRTPKHWGKVVEDWWSDIGSGKDMSKKERTGYPTQKPVKLLDRIIKASTNEQDVVLDPFCGCATTAISAEGLNRQWLGIDISPMAVSLVKERLRNELGLMGTLATEWNVKEQGLPSRTDQGRLPHYTSHKKALYGEQKGICNGCGIHFPYDNFHCDHIIPKSKGGGDEKKNIQLLCGACNSKKGTGSMSDLMARLLKERGIR